VLLLSAKGDTLWPSSAMADQVIARLNAKGFKHRREHIAYPDAGHAAVVPPSGQPNNSGYQNMGGTESGNAFARADGWARMLAFFKQALGGPK
jgi:dienelactone hydrolase